MLRFIKRWFSAPHILQERSRINSLLYLWERYQKQYPEETGILAVIRLGIQKGWSVQDTEYFLLNGLAIHPQDRCSRCGEGSCLWCQRY